MIDWIGAPLVKNDAALLSGQRIRMSGIEDLSKLLQQVNLYEEGEKP